MLDKAIGQVDADILVVVATEDSRHNADGLLTVGAPPDIMNDSHLLVANEENNFTGNTGKMTLRKSNTNGMGSILSRQKRNLQSEYAKGYHRPEPKEKTAAKRKKAATRGRLQLEQK